MNNPHSPEFLAEMKQRLEEEQTSLLAELTRIAKPASASVAGEFQADFPDYGRNEEDNATEMADYAASASTETILEERLNSIKAALERIEKGTYGMTASGETIPEERLRANPAATTLVKK